MIYGELLTREYRQYLEQEGISLVDRHFIGFKDQSCRLAELVGDQPWHIVGNFCRGSNYDEVVQPHHLAALMRLL